jgi:large subunit ribosomal protein L25
MTEKAVLEVNVRTPQGKGGARQLRFAGKIPGVCYGTGTEVFPVAIDPRQFDRLLRGPYGKNLVFNLNIKGEDNQTVASPDVMVKHVQKNPISRVPEHADFMVVNLAKPITVEVPIVLEGRSKGVAAGGRIRQISRSVKVSCTPDKIPSAIVYDVTELDLNSRVMASELTPPEGVALNIPHDYAFVQVAMPRGK